MTESAAWTALSDGAIWNYIELRKSFKSEKGGNEHLELPYSKVAWRKSKTTHIKHMRELARRGFIEIVEPGGLYHRPTIYRLSEKWKDHSREIIEKEGRWAIKEGGAKKPSSRDNIKNLEGKRTWEH